MKVHVITNTTGRVLGTVFGIPGFEITVIPLAGQQVHKLDASTVSDAALDWDLPYDPVRPQPYRAEQSTLFGRSPA